MNLVRYREFLKNPKELDGYGTRADAAKFAQEFPNPMDLVRVE